MKSEEFSGSVTFDVPSTNGLETAIAAVETQKELLRAEFSDTYEAVAMLRLAAVSDAELPSAIMERFLEPRVIAFLEDSGRGMLLEWVNAFQSTFEQMDQGYETYCIEGISRNVTVGEWINGIDAGRITIESLAGKVQSRLLTVG